MEMTDAQKKLIFKTVHELRKAVDERNQMTADTIMKYDIAVRDEDEDQMLAQGVLMMFILGMADPVIAVMRRYSEVSKLLKDTGAI